MEKEYFCTLKPLDMYFFGGERNFQFDSSKNDGKVNYYITSEEMPRQSTVLGTVRFSILQKNGLLNDIYYGDNAEHKEKILSANNAKKNQQCELIGERGFSLENTDYSVKTSYGKLDSISPVFICKKIGEDEYHRLIPTPLNHNKKEKPSKYCPLTMQEGFYTELGNNTLLPTDYAAKEGLATGSFIDLDDSSTIVDGSEIFEDVELTRIARKEDVDGLFKKKYKKMKSGYSFAFYCKAEENALPTSGIVYMGQEKSPFMLTAVETVQGEEKLKEKIGTLPGHKTASVYYALADILLDIDDNLYKDISFSIIQSRQFRTLNDTGKYESFRLSRKKSSLYNLVQAGSIFYIEKEKEEMLQNIVRKDGLIQIGLNHLVKMGGAE